MLVETDKNGNTQITQDNGKNPDGSDAITSWSIPASQAEKHIETFKGKIPNGELTALKDKTNEYLKQLKS